MRQNLTACFVCHCAQAEAEEARELQARQDRRRARFERMKRGEGEHKKLQQAKGGRAAI